MHITENIYLQLITFTCTSVSASGCKRGNQCSFCWYLYRSSFFKDTLPITWCINKSRINWKSLNHDTTTPLFFFQPPTKIWNTHTQTHSSVSCNLSISYNVVSMLCLLTITQFPLRLGHIPYVSLYNVYHIIPVSVCIVYYTIPWVRVCTVMYIIPFSVLVYVMYIIPFSVLLYVYNIQFPECVYVLDVYSSVPCISEFNIHCNIPCTSVWCIL